MLELKFEYMMAEEKNERDYNGSEWQTTTAMCDGDDTVATVGLRQCKSSYEKLCVCVCVQETGKTKWDCSVENRLPKESQSKRKNATKKMKMKRRK